MQAIKSVFRAFAAGAILFATGAPPAFAQVDDTLVVYNAQHDGLARAWADGFTKETGIKVTIRKGNDLDMANQLVMEGERTPADVFLTQNSPAMQLVAGKGRFAKIDAATNALVPERYRPADGMWIGVAARATVFVYNKSKLKPEYLPKTMAELAEPKWQGRWGASPTGADFQAIAGAYLQLKGEAATAAWLKGMKANARQYRGNGNAMRGVNAGEVDGALIYHYYYFDDQAKTGEHSNDIAVHYFRGQDPGAFVSVSGGGVLAASKRKEQAQAFLRWIAGNAGQEVLGARSFHQYAVGEKAESNPKLEPLAKLQPPKVEASRLDNSKVVKLMIAAGLL